MAEAESSGPEPQPVDRKLLAEATLLKVPYQGYLAMTPRERNALKSTWSRALRSEARRRGIDPDAFVKMTDEDRERMREEHPELDFGPRGSSRTLDDVAKSVAKREEPPPREVASVVDEDLSTEPHSADDAVPATEADPAMRERPTLGEVRPSENDDLVGWVQPRNLRDVYARYTVGDGQHFIRVERIEPKVWQQIPCSGYLGEIRDPLTEEEFHQIFGGRMYTLQVYGPDSRGRRDPVSGLPVIKPKTEPFRYTVPILPPNLTILPGSRKKVGDTMHPLHQMFGSAPAPTTPADAQMHKSSLDFIATAMQQRDEDRRELSRVLSERSTGSVEALRIVGDQGEKALQQAERQAEAREKVLQSTIESLRDELREARGAIDRVRTEAGQGRESPVKDAAEIIKLTNPAQSAADQVSRLRESHAEELARLKESHREQVQAMKDSHRDQVETLKTRQDDELKRQRERTDDIERGYRDKLSDAEKRYRERELELKGEVERVRQEERSRADERVKDAEKSLRDRIDDLKTLNERELRMKDEQHETRASTVKSTLEMQLANEKQRVRQLEDELEELKDEIAKAKDPVAIMKAAEEQAEALGYEKTENNAPKTPMERLAATVGMGLSKALEGLPEWLPKTVENARRGAPLGGPPVAGQLPPGMRPQQRQAPPGPHRGRSQRTVQWATANSVPVAQEHPTVPAGAPPEPPPAPPPAPPAAVDAAPPPAPPVPAPAAPPPQNGIPENKLSAIFPSDVMVQFRAEVERAIDNAFPAEEFARRFHGAYPEQAKFLVTNYEPAVLFEIVGSMPDGAESSILRRDGKRWVEKLWESIATAPAPEAPVAAPSPAPS